MSFAARLYTLSKKKNSTKQPDVAYTETMITLKEGTSQLDPIIKLDLGMTAVPHWNYMYVPAFNRYYFLSGSGWTWSERCWYGQFTVDPLASWKTQIGASRCYVLRSAAAYNGELLDNMYPITAGITSVTSAADPADSQSRGLSSSINAGSFVVGIISGDSGANLGSVSYYVFDYTSFGNFITALFGDAAFQVTDISDALYKSIFNPFQYIVSCVWIPMVKAAIPTTHKTDVKVGWWTITADAELINTDSRIILTGTLSRPDHPLAATRGKYLNAMPYTSVVFNYYPFGSFTVKDVPIDANTINLRITLDAITGNSLLELYTADATLARVNGQMGVGLELAQKNNNLYGALTGVASGALTSIGSGMSGNIPGTIAGVMSGITSIIEGFSPSVQTAGAPGSMAMISQKPYIDVIYRDIADDDNADRGRPLCDVRTLSTLSGYIMCANAEPAIPCSADELSAIISYLNGGFFYE